MMEFKFQHLFYSFFLTHCFQNYQSYQNIGYLVNTKPFFIVTPPGRSKDRDCWSKPILTLLFFVTSCPLLTVDNLYLLCIV